jgi:hypothetical protein
LLFFFNRLKKVLGCEFIPAGFVSDSQGSISKALSEAYNKGVPFGPDKFRAYVEFEFFF